MTKFAICMLALLATTSALNAASHDFTINLQAGGDTTPPTTPTVTSVTPLTYSQIDVAWSASTDDLALSGYRLFRDGVQIATTSLTSFSDTGLAPSTLYAYTVNAFDAAGNTSSTLAPLATTTLGLPATTTPPTVDEVGSSPTGSGRIILDRLAIDTTPTLATFTFSTRLPSRYALRWGRSSLYDGGFIITDIFRRKHETSIPELEPGTVYEYELIGFNPAGAAFKLSRGTFTTAHEPDAAAPVNVRNLRAEVVGDGVRLTWENPTEDDFSHVRVMRSHRFYPRDPLDGFFVYQGEDVAYLDAGAFRERGTQYYAVFAYDQSGNVSSGAVVRATPGHGSVGQSGQSVGVGTHVPSGSSTPPGSSGGGSPLEPLSAADVVLAQHEAVHLLSDVAAVLADTGAVTVRIPYSRVPEHLKSIILDVADPATGAVQQSYLMRINKDKTAYEAVVPSLGALEAATFTVQVFDHELRTVSAVAGTVRVSATARPRERAAPVVFPDAIVSFVSARWFLAVLGFLAALLAARYLVNRRGGAEEKRAYQVE